MRKYKPVEFQFDLEIERTVRRLRKKQRNSKIAVAMDDLQDMGNLNPRGEIQLVNAQRCQKVRIGRLFMGNQGITTLFI